MKSFSITELCIVQELPKWICLKGCFTSDYSFVVVVVDDVGLEISTTVVFCFTSEFALGRHWVK